MYLPQIAFLSAFEQLVEEIGLAQGARGAHINIYKSAGSSHVSLSHYGIKDKEQLFNTTYYYAPPCLPYPPQPWWLRPDSSSWAGHHSNQLTLWMHVRPRGTAYWVELPRNEKTKLSQWCHNMDTDRSCHTIFSLPLPNVRVSSMDQPAHPIKGSSGETKIRWALFKRIVRYVGNRSLCAPRSN